MFTKSKEHIISGEEIMNNNITAKMKQKKVEMNTLKQIQDQKMRDERRSQYKWDEIKHHNNINKTNERC